METMSGTDRWLSSPVLKKMKDNSLEEDTMLMLRVGDGHAVAFEILYKKYLSIVTDYAVSLNGHHTSIRDIVQETFTRLWQNRKAFRADSTFKTYIFGIARNVLSEEQKGLRKEKDFFRERFLKYRMSLISELRIHPLKIEKPMKDAMSQLTKKQEQAINLFYIEGLPTNKAAKYANCSIKAFEGRLFRARGRLRQLLHHVEESKLL